MIIESVTECFYAPHESSSLLLSHMRAAVRACVPPSPECPVSP